MPLRIVMTGGAIRAALIVLALVLHGCASTPPGAPRAPAGDATAGQLVLPSGRAIPVLPDALRFTGRAEYHWPDGRIYDGEWLDGLPHGQGTEILPDGETYRGAWRDGLRHGLGELLAADGSGIYQGEFHAGVRQGRGVRISDEGVYQGDWFADREHGYGELAGAYGSHYTGEWREGQRAGRGSYRGADGSAYEGEWLDDRPHGSGIYRFPDGSVYEGEWEAGRQHGTGRLQAASGVTFEGQWANAQRSGFGIEERPDGGRYAGEWQADKRHGQGRESWPDGTVHDGLWELNQPMGPGMHHYPTGIEIQGAWLDASVSSGLLTLPDGTAYAGPLFRDGNTRVRPMLQQWLETAAATGNPHAQLLAGTLYLDYAEPAPDPALARNWLDRAAATVPEAAFRLGALLLESTPDDDHRNGAIAVLEQAARAGHPEAARLLGDLFTTGTRVARDERRALAHYAEALRAGSPLAAERLARLLVDAQDPTLRDPERAIAVLEWVALHEGDWQQLATLARAFAARGDPSAAAIAQQQAVEAAMPVPGALPGWSRPRSGTPAPAASSLIDPVPVAPDIDALRATLARYRAEAIESPHEPNQIMNGPFNPGTP